MDTGIPLHGIALQSFRGIGKDTAFIGPFKRFNFMIGPNNSGKSTALNFISQHLERVSSNDNHGKALGELDRHHGSTYSQAKFGFAVVKKKLRSEVISKFDQISRHSNLIRLVDLILDQASTGSLIWVTRKERVPQFWKEVTPKSVYKSVDGADWQRLWNIIAGRQGGDPINHWVPESIRIIERLCEPSFPKTHLIPAIRQISEKGREFKDYSGSGLIDELAVLQNPGFGNREKFEKFNRINTFLAAVTQTPDARIEIPHDRAYILVHMNSKVLPLESLGTGIHEVILLAAFCTIIENEIVCIEEPEIHLHPLLQRRLIQYLESETNNQYFIATHSATVIDSADAAVFHVSNESGSTTYGSVINLDAKFNVLRDLGYKASDLLQSNFVIWVEGPSDRIYLNHWIRSLNARLKEGLHYSIMFYGGRLLSHLSAASVEDVESEIQSFIELKRLNRGMAVIIDSDKSSIRSPINRTKARLKEELSDGSGMAWITAGREIENYVSEEIMTSALRNSCKNFGHRQLTGRYDHVLPFTDVNGRNVETVDKVKVALAVAKQQADMSQLDLKKNISQLTKLIEDANR